MALDKNGKKLPKGITYRANENRYMGRFMYHGESYTVYGKTAREAQKQMDNLRYEVENNIYFKENSVLFSVWFDTWMNDYKAPTVKRGTVEVYRNGYNTYIKTIFGNKKLKDSTW